MSQEKYALHYHCSNAFSKYSAACEDFLNTSHKKGRSALCVSKCTFSEPCLLKDLLHTSHENGHSLPVNAYVSLQVTHMPERFLTHLT